MNSHERSIAVVMTLATIIIIITVVLLLLNNNQPTTVTTNTVYVNEPGSVDESPNETGDNEDSRTIVRQGELAKKLTFNNLSANDTLPSGSVITGMAPGNWFFEADAGYTVTDWDGRIIGQSYIRADDEWMTTELVPFTGTITYSLPADTAYNRGTIILQRSNPRDGSVQEYVEIPVELVPNS